jgi:hypothetical protein
MAAGDTATKNIRRRDVLLFNPDLAAVFMLRTKAPDNMGLFLGICKSESPIDKRMILS